MQVFFDKGILSMLYFPDDHKMAVYIPYFVPVLLPLLVGILREGKVYVCARVRMRVEGRTCVPDVLGERSPSGCRQKGMWACSGDCAHELQGCVGEQCGKRIASLPSGAPLKPGTGCLAQAYSARRKTKVD